jgi:hypothetical protein
MTTAGVLATLFYFALVAYLVRKVFTRRGRASIGPAAVGSFYEMMSTDKRRATEMVLEERAESIDPEHADDKPRR